MEQTRTRRFGVKGSLCLLSAMLATLGSPIEGVAADAENGANAGVSEKSEPPPVIDLAETAELPGVVIFPARVSGPRPITVVLHGMCGEPIRTCSHFAEQVTESANLVCPRASQRCAGGGASWPQAGFAQAVEAAVERAKAALPEPADDDHGRTLIGYSLGAYRALDIAQSTPGKYPRVMLIGAKVLLNQKLLAENGVLRVLLSAGGWDMMHDPMQHETERALRSGIRARFLDLGPVGHIFTPSFSNYLPGALAWLRDG
jgi:predicted esterase